LRNDDHVQKLHMRAEKYGVAEQRFRASAWEFL